MFSENNMPRKIEQIGNLQHADECWKVTTCNMRLY
jgi:hypothetical protein